MLPALALPPTNFSSQIVNRCFVIIILSEESFRQLYSNSSSGPLDSKIITCSITFFVTRITARYCNNLVLGILSSFNQHIAPFIKPSLCSGKTALSTISVCPFVCLSVCRHKCLIYIRQRAPLPVMIQ